MAPPCCWYSESALQDMQGWSGVQSGFESPMKPMVMVLETPCRSHVSYFGFMFEVSARKQTIHITDLQMASSTILPGPFLYRVYVTKNACGESVDDAEYEDGIRGVLNEKDAWKKVSEVQTSLP
ncbi:hypothetical protein GUITHDRAFT_102379 [Guillardia theta CCMP2712]|uniref:Uncharacterized protein n=1 Tax=Guillardia theta (strain CCMP2712) TaxID=905079 RepID=L1JUN0_GUITC|nr:hypothetical protein GUITHDRAFT_102379 [Guillardia theta CCMP2712]EKX51773.1 hypothetical protein GUITHDRAFT_102379 [Guillardia theta CCMP2712]|eukprot:XP_005838753.1 hypothetical protein GUITHDRAFT_102379 [Guillardia theta CCMP2712]